MTQLTLSKSTYLKESKKLANFKRYLPSLDLKRQQLMLEKNKAKEQLNTITKELQALEAETAEQLQMLANQEMQLGELICLDHSEITQQNLMGVRLPKLVAVRFKELEQYFLTRPHWVDLLIKRLQRAVELSLQQKIHEQRLDILQKAVRKASQRVNLVAKILIPQAENNMKKISIFLSDNERAAVVRSKLAKKKKQSNVSVQSL